jgi:WD40 repeat protein
VWLHLLERPPSPTPVWDATRPPYPGLESFVEQDAGVFFGREAQIAELHDRLHPTVPDQAHRFVAVIGPSGVGKSSLIQAGLLPRLAQRRSRWVIAPPLVPGDQPSVSLASALTAVLPSALGSGRSASVLLVIDQAEELLTRAGEKERAAFLGLLDIALRDNPKLWVVATLRSEFLTGLLTSGFAELFRNPMVIGSLARAALVQVIEGPAAQAGLTFAPGVVSELVDDTGGGDALPLLAYTLQALYLRAAPGGMITTEDCKALGGVAGALSRQADKVAAELEAADPDAPVTATLLRFVTLDGAEPTRRRVRRSVLGEAEQKVVDAFIDARLLTSDTDGDDAVIEVAHEALFRQWPPLRQAIEARADDLRQRAELERWASDWVRSGQRDAYLLRDERLQLAQQWAATQHDLPADLPLVHDLLDRSARSDRAAMERLSEAVARRALATVDHDPEQGLLLALAAIEECAPTKLAHRALLTALAACRLCGVLRGHEHGVWGVAWSPDGQRIATASGDRTARIWDAETGSEHAVLHGHHDWIEGVAWSLDSKRVATASYDGTARIWEAETGSELAALRGHEGWVWDVAWSPDGRRIATASGDRTARVWDTETATELATLHGHEHGVRGVAWSPDGQRIATASDDRTARVWDTETTTELVTLHGHERGVSGVAWSPDGQRIATASGDRTARVWEVETGTELAVLRGHTNWVQGVVWAPDSQRIATTSGDRTARVWEVETGTELAVLRRHENSVADVAWSPDGQRIATASGDRVVRVWDVEPGVELAVLRSHQEGVRGVAWSPDGQRIATASGDCTARVWDIETSLELAVMRGHQDRVADVAWSPDGRRIATASADRTARVWDIETSLELAVMCGHQDGVRGVAWSPDGRRIATASRDRTVRVWHLDTRTELAALRSHQDAVRGVAWSPDGQRIATASGDYTVRVWDIETNLERIVMRGHEDGVWEVAWSPDGQRIATASGDRTVRVWDIKAGRELAVLHGHDADVCAVEWSRDGRRIATASFDRTVRVWDPAHATELAIVGVHQDWVLDVAWSPDGQRIVSGSEDSTARIWDGIIDLDALVAKARGRVFRELTPEERRSVMLPEVAE